MEIDIIETMYNTLILKCKLFNLIPEKALTFMSNLNKDINKYKIFKKNINYKM